MHRRKTGALIECSVVLGALAAGITAGPELSALQTFGAEIGLAFQIQDDILDVEGDAGAAGQDDRRGCGAPETDLSQHRGPAGRTAAGRAAAPGRYRAPSAPCCRGLRRWRNWRTSSSTRAS